MRKFNVTVNGVAYDVEIEEVEAGAEASAPAAAPKAAPKAAAPKKAASAPAGAVVIKAPMPGTILKVNVSAGQAVKKGDVVAILEAMKMENEIFAPQDGTVASVNVNKGSAVKTEDVIITLN
ncbi:MAG: biotin/lipoyl-containing protein [Eubacteriales bacterium]